MSSARRRSRTGWPARRSRTSAPCGSTSRRRVLSRPLARARLRPSLVDGTAVAPIISYQTSGRTGAGVDDAWSLAHSGDTAVRCARRRWSAADGAGRAESTTFGRPHAGHRAAAADRVAPLLMLHDELGFPGWMRWNRDARRRSHELVIPLQPGYGHTPRVRLDPRLPRPGGLLRPHGPRERLAPLDVIGFSAGGYVAAEMAAMIPSLFDRMVLVAPLGLRPLEGEIFDFLAVTMPDPRRGHGRRTSTRPEFAEIYGGEHDARAVRAVRGRPGRDGPPRLGAVHVRPQPAAPPRGRRPAPDAAGLGRATT